MADDPFAAEMYYGVGRAGGGMRGGGGMWADF
jgi:hypothetical protein